MLKLTALSTGGVCKQEFALAAAALPPPCET